MRSATKPRAGVKIKDLTVHSIPNVSRSYFENLKVDDWTSPRAIIAKLNDSRIRSTSPTNALRDIQNSFKTISESNLVLPQLAKHALKSMEYSQGTSFTKLFTELYEKRRSDIEDRDLFEKTRQLKNKGRAILVDITNRALEEIRTLDQFDEGSNENHTTQHDKSDNKHGQHTSNNNIRHHNTSNNNTSNNNTSNNNTTQHDNTEIDWFSEESGESSASIRIVKPSTITYPTNEPKLRTSEVRRLKSRCYFGLSTVAASMMPESLFTRMTDIQNDQFIQKSLNQFPKTLQAIREILQSNYEEFPTVTWNKYKDTLSWDLNEQYMYRIAALTLTDFWGISQQPLVKRYLWNQVVVSKK